MIKGLLSSKGQSRWGATAKSRARRSGDSRSNEKVCDKWWKRLRPSSSSSSTVGIHNDRAPRSKWVEACLCTGAAGLADSLLGLTEGVWMRPFSPLLLLSTALNQRLMKWFHYLRMRVRVHMMRMRNGLTVGMRDNMLLDMRRVLHMVTRGWHHALRVRKVVDHG